MLWEHIRGLQQLFPSAVPVPPRSAQEAHRCPALLALLRPGGPTSPVILQEIPSPSESSSPSVN